MGNLRLLFQNTRSISQNIRKWSNLAGPSNLTHLAAFGAVVGKQAPLVNFTLSTLYISKNKVWLCSWILKNSQKATCQVFCRRPVLKEHSTSWYLFAVGIPNCSVTARALSFLEDLSCSLRLWIPTGAAGFGHPECKHSQGLSLLCKAQGNVWKDREKKTGIHCVPSPNSHTK